MVEMDFFLELIETRYERNTTIYCSLYPFEKWSIRLNKSVVGAAIIERIVNGALNLKSGSLTCASKDQIKRKSIERS